MHLFYLARKIQFSHLEIEFEFGFSIKDFKTF